jgi:hypothetical protein
MSIVMNAIPGDGESPHPLKHIEFLKTFVKINNSKFLYTVTKTVIGVSVLKTIVFRLIHSIFRLLLIDGHSITKGSSEISFCLTKSQK